MDSRIVATRLDVPPLCITHHVRMVEDCGEETQTEPALQSNSYHCPTADCDLNWERRLAAELGKTFPLDTLVQRYWLPTIRAAVAMEHKNLSRATELLKETSAIELGSPSSIGLVFLLPVYMRGEAYLGLGGGDHAAGEFQKFIDHSAVVGNFSWGALARLGLARAYALEARTAQGAGADAARAKARAAYTDFLTLWKDADPDIPILIAAKAEYAKLN